MTLIAAFRALGMPVLLGDFFVTAAGQPFGLRRKLRRINPHLVVAWTGSLFTAEAILRDLDAAFAERTPTRRELEATLAAAGEQLAERQAKVKLIGWAACPDVDGFGWESDSPGVVHWGDYTRHDGSGYAAVAQHAADGIRSGGGDPIDHVVTAMSFLFADEWGNQQNRADGFGFGYEAVYWDGAEFQYINNVLYVPWTTTFDPDGMFATGSIGTLYRTTIRSEHSIVLIVVPGSHEVTGHVIAPVGAFDPNQAQDLMSKIATPSGPDLTWDRCGLVVSLRAEDYVGPDFMVAGNANFKRLVELTADGVLRVGLDTALLEQIYASVRENERQLGGDRRPRFRAFLEHPAAPENGPQGRRSRRI